MHELQEQLHRIERKIDALARFISRKDASMAVTIQQILDKDAAILKTATDALTLDAAIKVVIDGQTARLVDLQAQLDAAIAAGSPAALQAVSDGMDQIIAAQNSDAAAKAILAGTPPGTGKL